MRKVTSYHIPAPGAGLVRQMALPACKSHAGAYNGLSLRPDTVGPIQSTGTTDRNDVEVDG